MKRTHRGRPKTKNKKSPLSSNVIEQREFPQSSVDDSRSEGSSRSSPNLQTKGRRAKGTCKYPPSSRTEMTRARSSENPSKKPLMRPLIPFEEINATCTPMCSSDSFLSRSRTSDLDRFIFVCESFGPAHAIAWARDNQQPDTETILFSKQPSSPLRQAVKLSQKSPKRGQ
jgi:hypothetical protein